MRLVKVRNHGRCSVLFSTTYQFLFFRKLAYQNLLLKCFYISLIVESIKIVRNRQIFCI